MESPAKTVEYEQVKKPDFELIEKNIDHVMAYSHEGFASDQVGAYYDKLSEKYELVLRDCVGYADPDMVAKAADNLEDLPKEAEFLDFASGTGLIGDSLKEKGFSNFTGIDASLGMMGKCAEKGLYKDIKNLYCGAGQLPREFVGKFDAAVSAGSFIPDHLPTETFNEMYDSVKVGGYLIFTMRDAYYETLGHK